MKNIQVIPVKYGSGAEILSLIEEDTLFIYSNNSWHQDENSIGLPIHDYQHALTKLITVLSQNDYRRILLEVDDGDEPLFGCNGVDYRIRQYITDIIMALDNEPKTYGGREILQDSLEYSACRIR